MRVVGFTQAIDEGKSKAVGNRVADELHRRAEERERVAEAKDA